MQDEPPHPSHILLPRETDYCFYDGAVPGRRTHGAAPDPGRCLAETLLAIRALRGRAWLSGAPEKWLRLEESVAGLKQVRHHVLALNRRPA